MSEENNSEEYNGLSEVERLELENMVVDAAFRNSFKVITKEKNFSQIMEMKVKHGMSAIMAHNPDDEPSMDTLENMMAYFVETEEYEKCSKIRDIIKDREIDNELKEIIPDVHI
mgnify:CR=1 FL=1|tara:strand:+ start:553 stop:894 length:342 start_codon:yes stop_codon:yes gene_type:complete